MTEFSVVDHPHRRYNPLIDQWVLNSPHRTKRPWLGKKEAPSILELPKHDSSCYLCPGNKRANGEINPDYTKPFVFNNDYPALLDLDYENQPSENDLFKIKAPKGTCRVVCFSPRHDLTLPELPVDVITEVIDVWADQVTELSQRYKWVQVFENKGELMGCSNPHPHCQIWALDLVPNEPAKESETQEKYLQKHQSNMLMDYQQSESKSGERTVLENDSWLVVVPFWAIWPFETLVLPKRHIKRLPELSSLERIQLAEILKLLLIKYDNLFECSFPYSMGWHGAPGFENDDAHWLLHAHFYPPLLRSATVRKFMVGFETLAEPQRDLTPEQAAERIWQLPNIHFRDQLKK